MIKTKARFILDRDFVAGATEDGLVRLYAPSPVQPGSSKSQFDTMVSLNLFEDIGRVLQ